MKGEEEEGGKRMGAGKKGEEVGRGREGGPSDSRRLLCWVRAAKAPLSGEATMVALIVC